MDISDSSSQLLLHLQISKRSLCALISLLSLTLLAYNSATIFCTHVPIPPAVPATFPPANVTGKSRKVFSLPSAKIPFASLAKDQISSSRLKTHLPLLHKNRILAVSTNRTTAYLPRRRKKRFEVRVAEFFGTNCKSRFFMTWISPMELFGEREFLSLKSLFKSHPNGCLIIASDSLDSIEGLRILKPLGFRVAAISPDFEYLFNNTPAEAWYNRLIAGKINTGEVSLGQNLSNLLRLGLLYRFGGIYLDTDVVVLKSLVGLKNAIGAQTVDLRTGNWSRLNNAVMIFDQGHPLMYKFIQEFALTFDGNKWGHNGPYLVSRVVARVSGRPGYDFTVMPPMAFYPVDWSRIGSLFIGPRNSSQSKWVVAKLRQIRSLSFAVHLWNKQSRGFEVEDGSIIQHIMLSV